LVSIRVGIDCLFADPRYKGGVNSYTLGLLGGFSKVAPSNFQFILFCTEKNRNLFSDLENSPQFQIQEIPLSNSFSRKLFRGIGIFSRQIPLFVKFSNIFMENFVSIANGACDILYCPYTVLTAYNFSVPTLLSMHDIQHVHFPEFFSFVERWKRHAYFSASAQYATYFQASSMFIKEDLLSHFPWIREDQIVVIPEGVDVKLFSNPPFSEDVIKSSYSIPFPYLFLPANLWKHKNHITVLRALTYIRKKYGPSLPLVMTGAPYSAYKEVMEYIQQQNLSSVYYLGVVDFATLRSLYHWAYCTIVPPLYESSSLVILESIASGTPVIASKTPPNEEMGKALKMIFFEPLDYEDLGEKIFSLWRNQKERDFLREVNEEAIYQYDWKRIAQLYLSFIAQKFSIP